MSAGEPAGRVVVEDRGRVTHIVLCRPDKRNALTPGMVEDLRRAVIEAGDRSAAVVLRGEGPAFCAGFDLALCQASPDGAVMRSLLTGLSAVVGAMRASRAVVVVGAHGWAVAGGCALLGGADVVVADRACRLGYPVVRIGVSPAVSAPFLRRAVGDGACRALQLDPGLIDGVRGLALGLVHELVDEPGRVAARAGEIADELVAKGAGVAKGALAGLETGDLGAGAGLRASLGLTGGAEERERLAALRL